jgi:Flp pilus assembly protein TadG
MNNVIESRLAIREESGQTLPLIALFMVILLVMLGAVIDLGNAYRVQQQLQASADAAATAGAGQLSMSYPPVAGNAITTAQNYGSEPSGKNPITGVPASDVTESASASCVTQTTFRCVNANTVTVNESAKVPTSFLSLVGINSLNVSVHSQACSPCGTLPLDIQLVVDRTGSMLDSGGSTNTLNKIENLKQGLLQGFLPTLDPSEDYVGLTLLPPDKAGTSDVCSPQDGQSYNVANPTYTVVPLSNNYMDMSGNLIGNSPLVSDINCLQAGGSTDYANAMESAYAELQKDGRPGVQKVIVLLSDGAANTGQNCNTDPSDPHCTQPCQTAVNDAATYKSQGILVYTVLYGQVLGTDDVCTSSKGVKQGLASAAMTNMATPGNYFSDPDPANLENVFQKISMDMGAGSSRLTQ